MSSTKAAKRTALVLSVLACAGLPAIATVFFPSSIGSQSNDGLQSRPAGNAIVRENRLAGTTKWRSDDLDAVIEESVSNGEDGQSAEPGTAAAVGVAALPYGRYIAGFATKDSINQGETVELRVSSIPSTYDVDVFRIGWYNGARSRLYWSRKGVKGTSYPAPSPDAFGTVSVQWPVALRIPTDSSWTSGIYIAKFAAGGDVEYATWVVRNDASTSAILLQVPTSTYQAYEAWGGASLYQPAKPAVKVSYDRPYYAGDGTGLLFNGDAQTATFLEREGLDVSYATSTDTHSNPSLMASHKMFLSPSHDEYWSKEMRDNLDAWIAAGKNVAFLAANNMYWQIRFESGAQSPNRVIVSYKSSADPMYNINRKLATLWWRSAEVGRPESAVTGNWYDDARTDFSWNPWVVSNASHWFYSGTGLRNGDSLPGVVGIEWDLIPGGIDGVTELSNSPLGKSGLRQQAAHRLAKSGAQIFDAGSLRYSLFLDDPQDAPNADKTTMAKVQQMTRNLVKVFASQSGTVPPTTVPVVTTTTTTSTLPATTSTIPTTTTTAPTTTTTSTIPSPEGGSSNSVARASFEGGFDGFEAWASTSLVQGSGLGAKDGVGYLEVSSSGSGGSAFRDVVRSVLPGDSFSATVWVTSASSDPVGLWCVWALGGGVDERACKEFRAVPGEYVPVQVVLKAKGAHSMLRLQMYVAPSTGTIRFDALKF